MLAGLDGAFVKHCAVYQVYVLLCSHGGNAVHIGALDSVIGIEGYGNLVLLALAGGDKDYSRGGTGSVDGGRCGILEDADGLDIGGVEVLYGTAGYAVDYVKRGGVTSGVKASDCDLGSAPGHTAGTCDVHARRGAVQGRKDVGSGLFLDFIAVNGNHGSRYETFLLGTVSNYDGLFKGLVVFCKRYCHRIAVCNHYGLRGISY